MKAPINIVYNRLRLYSFIWLVFMAVVLYLYYNKHLFRNTLTIDVQKEPLHVVSEKFLSVAFDTKLVSNGIHGLHLNSKRFQTLASELSPAHFRLGGTLSERLIFMDDEDNFYEHLNKTSKYLPFFVLTSSSWQSINTFCQKSNLSLVFSVNVLLRNGDVWDPRNAIELIKYSKKNNFKIDFQLGNEPNSFLHVFNISISARQLSSDFKMLRIILNELGYSQSYLIGPDTTRPQPNRPSCLKYMVDFLSHDTGVVNVISWHQYYLNSRTATLYDFWNPDTLDLLKNQIETMIASTNKYRRDRPMWLSETSSSYGGGADGLSNTFASSPMWLDKLGLASQHGISVVMRQSLLGGFYSLIDPNLTPLPDWWVSWIYKKLVGPKVVDCRLHSTKYLRLYCGCATKEYCANNTNCIVIYGMNLANYTSRVFLKGTALGHKHNADSYEMTALSRNSKNVYLNGNKLEFGKYLPNLVPTKISNLNFLLLGSNSLGFWILKNTALDFCMK